MLKDSFGSPDRELSQNKTWVSLLSQEKSHSNKYVDLGSYAGNDEALGQIEETIFSKSVFLKDSSVVDIESQESTKTCGYIERHLLIYEEGEQVPKKYVLNCGILTIGRGKENHIVATDPRASRKHFVLEVRPDLVELIDFSSENGTKVNGVNVRKCILQNGDHVLVGKTVFVFQINNNSQKHTDQLIPNQESKLLEEGKKELNSLGCLEASGKIEAVSEHFTKQDRSLCTEKRRLMWGEIKQFACTVAVVIFFIAATICLVLGGAMIGRLFQEEKIEQLQLFYHKLGKASRVAAFGDIKHAEVILNELRHLPMTDVPQKTHFSDTESFIGAIKKLNAGKHSKDFSLHEEPVVKDKKLEVEKKKLVQEPVRLDEKWRQAISLYKSGKEKSACDLVKKIAAQAKKTNPLATKAQSFLERRCS